MKRNVYYLSVLLLAGCMVGGCSDEQGNTANVPAASGEPIRFSVSTDNVKSRTVYDELEENGWTLDWVTGDEIGIYTTAEDKYVVKWNSVGKPVNDGSKYAVYYIKEVNPQGHQHEGTIDWNDDHLVWGESVEENPWLTFYGAYPAEEVIGVNYPNSGSEGIIQMDYHTNQLAVINKKEGDTYVAPPDMKEAYMIAKRNIQPSGEHILLDFDPIMTTLNLNITAGGYEEKTGIIDPVTITGVSVMMPHGINNGEFKYDTAGMENDGTHGELAKDIQSDYKESIYVGIQNGLDKNKRYIDLFEGESVNLFAFLPPVDMTDGATIKVHTKGALNFVLDITQEMIKQSRIDIQLPDVSPESENELMVNNWISQLDGNIHLSQMSIPGYDCEDEETPEKIETLLKMGVRVFDIENIIDHGGGIAGYQRRKLPDALVKVFNSFILNNKGEFIILLYEDDNDKYLKGINLGSFKNDINAANWKTMSISELKGKIVAFEWRTTLLLGSGYVASKTEEIWNTDPYTFNRFGIVDKEQIGEIYPNIDWNMVYMNWDKNATEGDKIDVTKTIYEKVASDNKQNRDGGCTGIVLVPNAGITYNQDEQYTYSDLLIQAIIDCNYKLILDRN